MYRWYYQVSGIRYQIIDSDIALFAPNINIVCTCLQYWQRRPICHSRAWYCQSHQRWRPHSSPQSLHNKLTRGCFSCFLYFLCCLFWHFTDLSTRLNSMRLWLKSSTLLWRAKDRIGFHRGWEECKISIPGGQRQTPSAPSGAGTCGCSPLWWWSWWSWWWWSWQW